MKVLLTTVITSFIALCAMAQSNETSFGYPTPKVFLIGQYESQYNQLSASTASFVDVCDDDVRKAYWQLRQLAVDMQKSAFAEGFDLNGVKCWIHFFWNPDGSIRHIVYYLKPSSRNISTEALTAFFTRFANTHRLPIQANSSFQLYTSLSFPVLQYEKAETLKRHHTQY